MKSCFAPKCNQQPFEKLFPSWNEAWLIMTQLIIVCKSVQLTSWSIVRAGFVHHPKTGGKKQKTKGEYLYSGWETQIKPPTELYLLFKVIFFIFALSNHLSLVPVYVESRWTNLNRAEKESQKCSVRHDAAAAAAEGKSRQAAERKKNPTGWCWLMNREVRERQPWHQQ